MADFAGLLSRLKKEDLKAIAERVRPSQNQRNDFCRQEGFGKSFSQLDKGLLCRFISSHITIYDLDHGSLLKIYREFFNCQSWQCSELSSHQIISCLRERKSDINLIDSSAHHLSVLFIGIYPEADSVSGDDFIVLRDMLTPYSANVCTYHMKSLSPHHEESRFHVRNFFERNSTSATFLLVLSGHGTTSGALQLSSHTNFSIQEILRQWHYFASKQENRVSTLVLVCDYCYSGAAVSDVACWNCREPCCQRIIVHTACLHDKYAYDGVFIPAMVDMFLTAPNGSISSSRTIHNKRFENGWQLWNCRDNWQPNGIFWSNCYNCRRPLIPGSVHHCRVCKNIVCGSCLAIMNNIKVCSFGACQNELLNAHQTPVTYARHGGTHSFDVRTQNGEMVTFFIHDADAYRTIWNIWLSNGAKVDSALSAVALGGAKSTKRTFEVHELSNVLQVEEMLQYGGQTTLLDTSRALVKAIESKRMQTANCGNIPTTIDDNVLVCFTIVVYEVPVVDVAIKLCDRGMTNSAQYYVKAVRKPGASKWLVDKSKVQCYGTFLDETHSLRRLISAVEIIDDGQLKWEKAKDLFDLCGVFGVEVLRFVDIAKEITVLMNDFSHMTPDPRDRAIKFPKVLLNHWDDVCKSGRRRVEIGLALQNNQLADLQIARQPDGTTNRAHFVRFHLLSIRELLVYLQQSYADDDDSHDQIVKGTSKFLCTLFPAAATRAEEKRARERQTDEASTAVAEAK